MNLIPAGTFPMGNTVAADTDITDAVPIDTTVSAFFIDVNEVSLKQWKSVYHWATGHGYTFTHAGTGRGPNFPVEWVSWYDAVKWCNARSEQAGMRPVYYTNDALTVVYRSGDLDLTSSKADWTADGFRLPTEAEWERAARGGLSGQRFPWGDLIERNLANYYGNTLLGYDLGPNGQNPDWLITYFVSAASPGGSFALNGFGLNDMAGNVREWCWDRYGTPYAGGTDPHGPVSGSERVARDCNYSVPALFARCGYRDSFAASASGNIGFRAVTAAR